MSTIDQLNQGTPTTASQIPYFDVSAGQTRRCSVQALQAVIAPTTPSNGYVTQYEAPNATGFSIGIAPPTPGQSMYLLMSPTAGFATGTITLPAVTTALDGQQLLCFSAESLGALTVNGAGAAVIGAPGALSANDHFLLRYDAVHVAWYRVG